MANNCSVCQRPDTKYSCVNCVVIICNGYSEENYRVGKCKVCQTSTSTKESEPPPQKKFKTGSKKQAQLTSFFSKPQNQSEKPIAAKSTNTSTLTVGETNKNQQDAKAKEIKRTVTIETIEKNWKTKQLARYDADVWLSYDVDGKYACNLHCNVCAEQEQQIKAMKYFNRTWISGCTNYRSCKIRTPQGSYENT